MSTFHSQRDACIPGYGCKISAYARRFWHLSQEDLYNTKHTTTCNLGFTGLVQAATPYKCILNMKNSGYLVKNHCKGSWMLTLIPNARCLVQDLKNSLKIFFNELQLQHNNIQCSKLSFYSTLFSYDVKKLEIQPYLCLPLPKNSVSFLSY